MSLSSYIRRMFDGSGSLAFDRKQAAVPISDGLMLDAVTLAGWDGNPILGNSSDMPWTGQGAGSLIAVLKAQVVLQLGQPLNLILPTITGVVAAGQTLGVSNGSWTGAPTSYSYQWFADGAALVGATQSTYVVTQPNAAKTFSCAVSATNAAGKQTVTTLGLNASGVVVPNTNSGSFDFSDPANSGHLVGI